MISLPPVLYKVSELRWAEKMTRDGEVRVGTLAGYRAMEGWRGDAHEGELDQRSGPGAEMFDRTEDLPRFMRRGVHVGTNGLATIGTAYSNHSQTPDMFVYCTSEELDAELRAERGGAAVRIISPPDFFSALDKAVREQMERLGVRVSVLKLDRCVYEGRIRHWASTRRASRWLLKEPTYEREREIRAGWRVIRSANPLLPFEISSPDIARACERVS